MAARSDHESYRKKDKKKAATKRTRLTPIKKVAGPKTSRLSGPGTKPPGAKPPAPKPGPPPAPTRVAPFMNGQDLLAFNDFMAGFSTSLANIDFDLGNLQTDTDFQKTENNAQAKEQTAATQDVMAARGLFRSSIKDAALIDVEATRSLHEKFLDDKLTAATLNSGTQKKLLGQSKQRFDEAMVARKAENAQSVNDPLIAAWAEKMAAYSAAQKKAAPATGGGGGGSSSGGGSGPKAGSGPKHGNTNQGQGNANRKAKKLRFGPQKNPKKPPKMGLAR